MKKIILSALITTAPLYSMYSTSYDADQEDSCLNSRHAKLPTHLTDEGDTTFDSPTVSLIESYLHAKTLIALDDNNIFYPDLTDTTIVYTQDRMRAIDELQAVKRLYSYFMLPALFYRLKQLANDVQATNATTLLKYIPIQDQLLFQAFRLHEFITAAYAEEQVRNNRKKFKKAFERETAEDINKTRYAQLYSESRPFVDLKSHIWTSLGRLNAPVIEDISD